MGDPEISDADNKEAAESVYSEAIAAMDDNA